MDASPAKLLPQRACRSFSIDDQMELEVPRRFFINLLEKVLMPVLTLNAADQFRLEVIQRRIT